MLRFFIILVLALGASGAAQSQTATASPAACQPWTGFPLSINLGSGLNRGDGETVVCALGKVQSAVNALSAGGGGGGGGSYAPIASPTFTGTVSAPLINLASAGSTGDVSGMTVTANGATQTLSAFFNAFPGAGSNIAGTGSPGMDNMPGFFLYQHPATFSGSAGLRVQREVPDSPASTSGNTYKSIWGVTYTSPTQAGYEWNITGELHNRTQGSTGAQNVAVNGTAFKEVGAGAGQIGPTWASNFACDDRTGQVNPTWSCIGSELDTYTTASGTDANRSRVGAQIVGGSIAPSTGAHIGYGILMNTARPVDVIDRGYAMNGAFGIGLDTTQATFTGAPILLGVGQRIAMDGDPATGSFARSFMWNGGALYWTSPSGNVFSLTDSGSTAQTGSATISGGINTSQLNVGNGGSPGLTYSYAGFPNAKTVALNNVVGNSENGPEFGGSFQLVSSGGSSNHSGNFKVALTSVYQALPGAADGWGANFSASSTSSVASGTGLIGLEIDLNNSHYTATTDPGSPYVTGLYLTGAGSGTANAGIIIAGSAKNYRDGIHFEDRSPSGQSIIQNATINDRSKSPNILVTNTTHVNGVDFINGTFAGYPFRSTGFSVDGGGSAIAANFTTPGNVNVGNGIASAGVQTGTLNVTTKAIIAKRTVGTSTTACTAGEIAFDSTYIYTCSATNSWNRTSAGASW